ncbi:MAG: peptide chain release factor-like protein [Oscillospiraceae bacterium]|jgi:protein subunit release factor B|nr:peptide chain release factor-like protein [Oscillospiraceae bacterium]
MFKEKQLLFSLSKANGDFIIQPFKGSGKGGQKRNKTMSCCRIIHPESGAVSECQEERSFEQNKKKAFRRLLEKPEFVAWYKMQVVKSLGALADIEEQVEKEMKNIKVEIQDNGKWVEWKEQEK